MVGGLEGLVFILGVGIVNLLFNVAAVVGGLFVWEKWVKPRVLR